MILILWYLGFVIVGDIVSYLIGLLVEREWGPHASLVVFLALYFLSLWVAASCCAADRIVAEPPSSVKV